MNTCKEMVETSEEKGNRRCDKDITVDEDMFLEDSNLKWKYILDYNFVGGFHFPKVSLEGRWDQYNVENYQSFFSQVLAEFYCMYLCTHYTK